MGNPQDTPESAALLRIVDANANRAAEGLRVVEEYARFALDDPHLSRICKQLRHDLVAGLGSIGGEALSMRDSRRDVGREVETEQEYQRSTLLDVVSASLGRVQQALRCLEEYVKRLDPALARSFEEMRYQSYDLERAVQLTSSSQHRLRTAQLLVLVDGGRSTVDFGQRVEQLVDCGVDLIQLRDKQLEDRDLLGRARILRQLTRDSATQLIVNDRPDIAVLAHADGVHLGQTDMAVADARRIVGPHLLLGVSSHSLDQARQAVADGANYIGVGPTFPSTTKQFDSFPGLSLLGHVSAEIGLPAFAIGGITLDRIAEVLAAGFRRVAVGAAVWESPHPQQTLRSFQDVLRLSRMDAETSISTVENP